ncbi:cysteine methyltransferase, partial [Methanosarcinales archaeon]
PYGELRTYKWIAHRVGIKGYRAIGKILSINPFPIIIPCHRVICTDGSLGGFSAGLDIKRRLLNIEGIKV